MVNYEFVFDGCYQRGNSIMYVVRELQQEMFNILYSIRSTQQQHIGSILEQLDEYR